MQVTIHDVGVCNDCPLQGGEVGCFSIAFGRIGKCGGCKHYGDVAACGSCERDSNLLNRRDLHGASEEDGASCGQCQRDLRLLRRRDRFEKGLPDKVEQQMNVDCAGEAGRRPMKDAINDWLRE